jgi:uncharacterized protein
MGVPAILLIAAIALLSSFVQSSTGFGFSIMAMSLFPLFMPYKQAAMVTAISSLVMVVVIAFKLRKSINFRLMLYPLISSTLTSLAGIFVMMASSDAFMRRILGIVLLLLSVLFIFFCNRIRIAQKPLNGLIAGAASGFLSGLFNLGGPPMAVYFLSAAEDKIEYNATLQCYFSVNGAVVLILHLVMGNFNMQIAHYSLVALAGVAVGTIAGYYIFKKLSFEFIRKSVYGFMMVFGVYLLTAG